MKYQYLNINGTRFQLWTTCSRYRYTEHARIVGDSAVGVASYEGRSWQAYEYQRAILNYIINRRAAVEAAAINLFKRDNGIKRITAAQKAAVIESLKDDSAMQYWNGLLKAAEGGFYA